ncbi:MAG: ribonuclease III [Alphaproteobacteria bacterium]|nr:ribonuclease III [Alphaproteobacteria bacterium]
MTGALENKISYAFSDPVLLETALTHSSVQKAAADNERLEFLGDRVLGLAVAALLFRHFPHEDEGSLAKRHTGLVQQNALVRVAQAIDLSPHLKLSAGEAKSGGQEKETILADALEALIGAIYLDGGFGPAHDFIEKFWSAMLHQQAAPPEDAKSRLQEWAQAKSLPLPEYTLLGKSGTDHAPQFEIEVSVKGVGRTSAVAASKRAAEKSAARKMLEKIGIEE